MKLFILSCAYIDDMNTLGLETPKVFKTRQEAITALEERVAEYKDYLSQWMDSEIDLENGIADIYTNDDQNILFEIEEVEV